MALGQNTVTTIQHNLKTRYPQSKIDTMSYEDSAGLGTIKKNKKFGGNNTRITVNYGRSQGSADFTEALANVTADDDIAFTVTRVKDYQICQMSSEAIEASKGDENALMEAFDRAYKNSQLSMKRQISFQLYRNGGGARGQVSSGSTVASQTITLSEASDVVHFEQNMFVRAATTDGTSGAQRTGKERITGCNRMTGALTCASATWDTVITAIATGDYLFRSGDFGATLKGYLAWLPTTAPSSGDSFFGVDRSVDAVRLAGCRYTASAGQPKEDTVQQLLMLMGVEGGKPKKILMNNRDRKDIADNLGARATYEMAKSVDGHIGYKGLVFESDKGSVLALADPNCPKGKFFALQDDSWELGSLGDMPHVVEDDGKMLERQSSTDGIQWRLRWYGQQYCFTPGYNGVGVF